RGERSGRRTPPARPPREEPPRRPPVERVAQPEDSPAAAHAAAAEGRDQIDRDQIDRNHVERAENQESVDQPAAGDSDAERRSIEDPDADRAELTVDSGILVDGVEGEAQQADQSPLAAAARLGSEALGRLRARYAEVMTRIAERPMDETAREELKTRAQRLNPDMWVTSDEVAQALEEYETVFESLRSVIGGERRRRRGRRRSGRREGSAGNGQV
ncbi:MAG: hypothetical protein ACRD1V_08125, partial [Vicinamibacterales bacterium]